MILIICSLYSFLGNSALLGPAVYIGIYSAEFKIPPGTASNLVSYPNLAYGFGKCSFPAKQKRSDLRVGIYRVIALGTSILEDRTPARYAVIHARCKPCVVHTLSLPTNMSQFVTGLIGSSQCNSYGSLMACRVIHALGSGVCEALPVQLVNDIFFLHERGKRLGYYTGKPNRPVRDLSPDQC